MTGLRLDSELRSLLGVVLRKAVPAILVLLVAFSLFTYLHAYQQPIEIREEVPLYSYTARGYFKYGVVLKPNILYDDTVLYNPERVFLRLIDSVMLEAVYSLSVLPEPADVLINLEVEVVLSHPQVWSRRINYTGLQTKSLTVSYTSELELSDILSLAGNISKDLDIPATRYTVEIKCYARSRFTVENVTRPLNHVFSLQMTIDLYGKIVEFSTKNIHESDVYTTTVSRENIASYGFISMPVSSMRKLSSSLLALSLLATAVYTGVILHRRRKSSFLNDVAKIERKYRSRLIKATDLRDTSSTVVVKVNDISELVRISDELIKPIIHVETPEGHLFIVIEDNVKYVYEIPISRKA